MAKQTILSSVNPNNKYKLSSLWMMISFVAPLAISVRGCMYAKEANDIAKRNSQLQVLPLVSFKQIASDDFFGISIVNNGPGPLVVDSLTIYYANNRVGLLNEATSKYLSSMFSDSIKGIKFSSLSENTSLSDHSEFHLIGISKATMDNESKIRFLNMIDQNINIGLFGRSLNGDTIRIRYK